MKKNRIFLFLFLIISLSINAQTPIPFKLFLQKPTLKGASVSFLVKNVKNGSILYSYDSNRLLTPASVLKTVTTATALDILGDDFQYETTISYDGVIENGILKGNIYITGSGDPTLNSSELKTKPDSIIALWADAIQKKGIVKINGAIIADESIFDEEGISMKWLYEDLGSYYGHGSYGLNIFDNQFRLYLNSGAAGTKPEIVSTRPSMAHIKFNNYLTTSKTSKDSCMIIGVPFSNERSLYGTIPMNRKNFKTAGDIPDPPLYVATYFSNYIKKRGITVEKKPTCFRLPSNAISPSKNRKIITTTYSLPLKEIVRITNFVSHNMFADALLKTLGTKYVPEPNEIINSFDRGINIVKEHWNSKGLNTSYLWMNDGSGLAVTDKVTTEFLCDLYIYMANQSKASSTFLESLPKVGKDGTVKNMLKNTSLHEKAYLKSGSMSRIRCYGGYIQKGNDQYAIAILINNFSGNNISIRKDIEQLLLALF